MYQPDYGNRPRMLLAYSDAAYASQCGRYFRRLGWEVAMVASGAEARTLAQDYHPDVVVLEVALLDQTGWLTSAKISLENPNLRILLVTDSPHEPSREQLDMIGADQVVHRADGAEALSEAVVGNPIYAHAI